MSKQAIRRRHAAALALALGFCRPGVAAPDYPFESEMARLAGRSAKQCGIFRPNQDAHLGWKCALAAEQQGQPYWFAIAGQGEDSMFGIAAIRTPRGERLILNYDSNPHGGRALDPRFSSIKCSRSMKYQPTGFPVLVCGYG